MSALSFLARQRARLHAYGRRLLGERSAPGPLFWACFVGCIAGSSPFFGLHLPLCIALAWLFRLNKVTVYAAANISIPPTVPFIAYGAIQVGERLRHGRFLAMTFAEVRAQPARALVSRFFVDWLLGGLFVGAAIGLLLGGAVYLLARRRHAARLVEALPAVGGDGAPVEPAAESTSDAAPAGGDEAARMSERIREAARRFDVAPRPLKMYARFKYRLDPCYRRIAPLVDENSLTVDLGTGMGMLPIVVALGGGGRRVLGVDWDARKIAAGRKAAAGLDGVELVEGDLRAFAIPPCDAITLVDVLHYYEPAVQHEILARCAAAIRDGGQLLIRDGDLDKKPGGWTRLVEELAVKLGWNRGEGRTKFRAASELVAELEGLGFTVEKQAVAGSLHPGNVLFVAKRPRA